MVDGWIKLHRGMLKWEWFDDPYTVSLWLYLLLKANFEGKKYRGRLIERGQLVFGRQKASNDTGLTEQRIRTRLTHLESTGEITIHKTSQYSVITIVNYERYQCDNRGDNHQLTSNQPASNHILRNKERKKEKNNNILSGKPDPVWFKTIIDTLNRITGASYKNTSRRTQSLLSARWNEGYESIQDFEAVINHQYKQWANTDMQKYLRPETLFGNKFEGYLNDAQKAPLLSGIESLALKYKLNEDEGKMFYEQ